MRILPDNSSKIIFFVLVLFIMVGICFLLFSYDKETGYWLVGIGVIPMLLMFTINYIQNGRAR